MVVMVRAIGTSDAIEVSPSQVSPDFVKMVESVVSPNRCVEDVSFFLYDGIPVAALVDKYGGRVESVKVLGCPLCIRPNISKDGNGHIVISGKPAIPWSAVSDDDVRGPLRGAFALCPDCGSPVFDPTMARRPLPGEMSGFRDDQ
jgi:hypothetical protein